MVLGNGTFGRCLNHKGGPLMNGISAFLKEAGKTPSPSFAMGGYTEKALSVNHKASPHRTRNLPEPRFWIYQPPEL